MTRLLFIDERKRLTCTCVRAYVRMCIASVSRLLPDICASLHMQSVYKIARRDTLALEFFDQSEIELL